MYDILFAIFVVLICCGLSAFIYTYFLDIDDSVADLRRELTQFQIQHKEEISDLLDRSNKTNQTIDYLIKNSRNEKI